MFILRFTSCLLLLLFSSKVSFAQSDFHPGYIVTLSKDTLQGLVDNRTETKNGRFIYFKKHSSTEMIKYEPTDLMAYGFTGNKMYEAKIVNADSAAVVVFMELLVKGTISLYHFKADSHFYVEKYGQPIKALYQTEFKVMHEGKYYIKVRKDYVGILHFLMSECAAVRKNIDQLNLEFRQLIDLVHTYNQCESNGQSLQTKRTFLLLKKGIIAGGQVTNINFKATISEYDYLASSDFSTDIQPFGGLFINTTFPWITQKVSLQTEVQLAKAHYYSDSQRIKQSGTVTIHDELTIDLTYLRFPIFLRYTYPKGKFRPFFQAGAMFDLVVKKDIYMVQEEKWWESVYTSETYSLDTRRLHSFATLGVGIAHPVSKKLVWFLEARGAIGASLITPSVSSIYKAQTKIFTLQTGISF